MASGRSERGGGGLKIIIILAVVAYGFYAAIRIIPAVSDDKAMEKKTEEVLKFAGTQHWSIEDMKYQIDKRAKELNLPLDPEQIKVTDEGADYRAQVNYLRVVKLPFYTYRKDVRIDVKFTKY